LDRDGSGFLKHVSFRESRRALVSEGQIERAGAGGPDIAGNK
jgi:hypothetical protein